MSSSVVDADEYRVFHALCKRNRGGAFRGCSQLLLFSTTLFFFYVLYEHANCLVFLHGKVILANLRHVFLSLAGCLKTAVIGIPKHSRRSVV